MNIDHTAFSKVCCQCVASNNLLPTELSSADAKERTLLWQAPAQSSSLIDVYVEILHKNTYASYTVVVF